MDWEFLIACISFRCRRAHLRDCLELLKELVPSPPDHQKATTLALLQSAEQYIKVTVNDLFASFSSCWTVAFKTIDPSGKGRVNLHMFHLCMSHEISTGFTGGYHKVFPWLLELNASETKNAGWNCVCRGRARLSAIAVADVLPCRENPINQMRMQISPVVRDVSCCPEPSILL